MGQLAGVAELFKDGNGRDRNVESARTAPKGESEALPPPAST
jgi:hypothetical protein